LNKPYTFLLAGALIFIVLSLAVIALSFYNQSGFDENVPIDLSQAFKDNLVQRPLEYPAKALAFDGGKVFVAVSNFRVGGGYPSMINCFDGQNGGSLWNNSDYVDSLVVSEGRVYFGVTVREVRCLNATSGVLLWKVENQQGTGEAASRPNVAVEDGRLSTYTDHRIVLNATTGDFMWRETYRDLTDLKTFKVDGFTLRGDPYDGKFLYGTSGYIPNLNYFDWSNMYYFKLDTSNGDILWRSNVTWESSPFFWPLTPQVLAATDTQVIIYKAGFSSPSYSTSTELFSLDANTGEKLWSSPLVTSFYSPTVWNDQLLFSASDGYFYALRLADGTVAWKTEVDTQNLLSLESTPWGVSPIVQMDFENQRLFWSFGTKTDASPANYTSEIVCLDLRNGNINWNKQTVGPWLEPNAGMVVNNDKVFLTGNNALWVYNASTGDLIDGQRFEGSVLAPAISGNTIFVAAGRKLFAYATELPDWVSPPSVRLISPKNTTYNSANVTLEFTINTQPSWMGYSLDGQDITTITGNTTLLDLASGLHNVTLYAKDPFENIVTYETTWFNKAEHTAEPFPTTIVAASIVTVALIGLSVLVYFKKRNHRAENELVKKT
jgi:outer membrane protein assembly factor BamB